MLTHFGVHHPRLNKFVVVLTIENANPEAEEDARQNVERLFGHVTDVLVLSETNLSAHEWEQRVNG